MQVLQDIAREKMAFQLTGSGVDTVTKDAIEGMIRLCSLKYVLTFFLNHFTNF